MYSFYNAVKAVYGPRSHCTTPLRTADGHTLLKNQDGILERWAEHFNTLLNQDSDGVFTILHGLPKPQANDSLDQPPTFAEVLSAIHSLKNKTPGLDNVPAELIKQGGYICTQTLHRYITKVWNSENILQKWKDATIVTHTHSTNVWIISTNRQFQRVGA